MIGARDMGGHVVAICDKGDRDMLRVAEVTFPFAGEFEGVFARLLCMVPEDPFALHLCHAMSRPALGFIDVKQFEVNNRQVGVGRIE
jgi:hypothetical protein